MDISGDSLFSSSGSETIFANSTSLGNFQFAPDSSSKDIVFIDPKVDNYLDLIQQIEADAVIVLQPGEDGVNQITSTLAPLSNLSSVHIISHGSSGSLQLGDTQLNADNLINYTGAIKTWTDALSPDADIFFYGCNVASTRAGINLLNQLSDLTGADIAASDDLTGNVAQGGDWDLEVTIGAIESNLVLSEKAMQEYESVFAFYNGKEYLLTNTRLTWEQAQAEARSRGGNLVTINDADEQNWLRETFGTTEGFWIGINDRRAEGQFEWVNGEVANYRNWAPGEPNNNRGNQDFGWMNYTATGQWDDNTPTATMRGIIEISPSNPGIISLSNSNFTVNEGNGNVQIAVQRTGGSDGTVTVDYRTVEGTAQKDSDYQSVSDTLTFAPGETSKSVTIAILNDSILEEGESFSFVIDNVTGGATLLAPRTALVDIIDNDSPSGVLTYNGNQYLLTSSRLTWEQAQAEARSRGGNLVTINDTAEQNWLRQAFGNTEGFWIGINDRRVEGQFEWVSGQSASYRNWAPGEPNNSRGNQDFGWINYTATGQWDDNTPTATMRGIIEISSGDPPPPPNPTLTKEVVASSLNQPTAIDWTPDGQKMFIAEKDGVVKVMVNGNVVTTPFIDISSQVNSYGDRGLLDIAVHPDFPNNPYVYLLFTYEPTQVYSNTGLAGPDGKGNRMGRLIRVTANANTNYTTAIAGSEVILLGKNGTWNVDYNPFIDSTVNLTAPPAGIKNGQNLQDFLAADSTSHTIGSVEFGADGMLYVSNGDGTSYNAMDRRTVRVQDVDNLSGKILRIDPITGKGLSDNPFYNNDPDRNRSKVYQYGMRNPFRFTVDPNTNRIFIGDVGWTQWEEINSAGAGANFGWPYYEGGNGTNNQAREYKNLSEAQAFYRSGQTATPAILALNHNTGINAIVMGDVYTGNTYPDQYRGDLFFNDLGKGIVRNISFDPQGRVSSVETFTTGANYVVQMATGPNGNLYFVDLDDGQIGQWRFV